jgi:hypothetical protein
MLATNLRLCLYPHRLLASIRCLLLTYRMETRLVLGSAFQVLVDKSRVLIGVTVLNFQRRLIVVQEPPEILRILA